MSKTRLFPYDLVRVIALIMVICVHSIPDHYWAWAIGQPLFFACNGIFFILSGHFNLRTRDEGTLGRYYLRKVATIVLPVIVYTGMMIVWEMKQELFTNPVQSSSASWATSSTTTPYPTSGSSTHSSAFCSLPHFSRACLPA